MGSRAVLRSFLFTDLVGSTELKQRLGDAEAAGIIDRHDKLFRQCLQRFGGTEEVNPGDEFFATFDLPSDVVRCALTFLKGLAELDAAEPVKVRVGIHLGETTQLEHAESGRSKLVGLSVDTAARVMGLARPGQVLLTRHIFDSVRQHVSESPDGSPVEWLAHGRYQFKGVAEALEVFEVGVRGSSPMAPPTDSEKAQRVLAAGDEEVLGWRPAVGLTVPGRSGWKLERGIGAGGFGEVWLARHEKTRDVRAFKFCYDADRLRGLKRELTLFRLMKEVLGERRDIARLYEVRLDKPPFYLEMEYTNGGDLAHWAEEQGGLDKVPLTTRIELMAQVAKALAAAHSAGVIHKDVSPSNVLIFLPKTGQAEARLTDFGIGHLVSTVPLEQADITVTGFSGPQTMQREMSAQTGKRLYMAPEQIDGKQPTVQSDIYALGVLLFQMVVGDLDRPLDTGWDRQVEDDLLRQDIATCVAARTQDRFSTADQLAQRLKSLPERRKKREARDGPQPAKIDSTSTVFAPQRKAGQLPTDMFPGYKILKELHRGGQGIVYQAVQLATKRKVAIKVMLEGPFAGRDSKRRFEREIALVGSLRHPNIVPVFDSGVVQGHYYFAMEYVRGQPLTDYVRSLSLSVDDTLGLFKKVCDAIDYAHQKGVIHRDLKPSNILVDTQGEPHVLDFGLAKVGGAEAESMLISITGQVMGTLGYMSPEQAAGQHDEVDMRSDVYALGVILYELLTGKNPYDLSGQMAEVLTRIIQTDPPRPSTIRRHINNEVETIVLKALSKEKQRRYVTAGTFGQDIGRFLSGEAIDAKRNSGWYVLRKTLRRYKARVAVTSAFVLLFVGFTLTLSILHQRAVEAEQQAAREKLADDVRALLIWLDTEPTDPGDKTEAVRHRQTFESVCTRIRSGTATTLDHQAFIRAVLTVRFEGRSLADANGVLSMNFLASIQERWSELVKGFGLLVFPHLFLDGRPVARDLWPQGELFPLSKPVSIGNGFLHEVDLGTHRVHGHVRVQIVKMLRDHARTPIYDAEAEKDYRPYAGAQVDLPVPDWSFTVVEAYPDDYPPRIVNEEIAREIDEAFILERVAFGPIPGFTLDQQKTDSRSALFVTLSFPVPRMTIACDITLSTDEPGWLRRFCLVATGNGWQFYQYRNGGLTGTSAKREPGKPRYLIQCRGCFSWDEESLSPVDVGTPLKLVMVASRSVARRFPEVSEYLDLRIERSIQVTRYDTPEPSIP